MRNIPKDKTKGSKKTRSNIWPVPAKTVAQVVGCSEDMVRRVRTGVRNDETKLGTQIAVADMLLEEGANKLLAEIKRVITFE